MSHNMENFIIYPTNRATTQSNPATSQTAKYVRRNIVVKKQAVIKDGSNNHTSIKAKKNS